MANSEILLGLTTTSNSDWRGKIGECDKLGISRIALFPTAIDLSGRKELYALLENSPVKSIPHVHLRNDMEEWELDLFVNKYDTQVFNVHARSSKYPFDYDKIAKYRQMTYIENQFHIPDQDELSDMSAGLCIDFAHWESDFIKGSSIRRRKAYRNFEEKIRKFGAGVAHISAIRKYLGFISYDSHMLHELKDLDYMKNYAQFIPRFASLELENSFEEQIGAKKYLEGIISK